MIINIKDNGRILKNKDAITLPDLTVLTGENGSGKTQLLEYFRDYAGGHEDWDPSFTEVKITYPMTTDEGAPLTDIVFSFPGLRNYERDFYPENPLIDQIKNQWNVLMPIVRAYGIIAHKEFDDEKQELNDLNNAIIEFVKVLTVDSARFTPDNLKKADTHQLLQLKRLAHQASKSIEKLTFVDFLIFYSIPTDIFSSALDLLFHQFHLKQKYYIHLTGDVIPPWEVFNNILEEAKFNYRVEYTPSGNDEIPASIRFIDEGKGISNTTLDTLSSGEKTIMALIFVLYHASNNGKFPEVILFDEPDAHLHPSLTQLFISVIQEVLVNVQKVKVILTTHSPSTIALAPAATIYRMDRILGYPIKEEKDKAVQNLSNGLASITTEEGNLGITYTVKNTEKSILFTEGITDKIILQIAWRKLHNDAEIPFLIQDCFCASFLSNLFVNGKQKYEGIFEIEPDKIMIALFDFDNAGYNSWNKKGFSNLIEDDPRKCLTKSNGEKGYQMLLPVPNIEEIESQVIKNGNETFKEKSLLTIESLFFNVPDFKDLYFSQDKLPGGGFSYQFNGDKRKFAMALEELDQSHFKEFIPLFDKICFIISTNP
ncbi:MULTISPECIES: AAA family ATPase [Chryseobacterium]|uniref:ATPase n=1 Tax=Chryseobacterium rhizosphaerae TaxID=395937 RepID=A0AAE3Y856_9FLAO|nr:MULTISPECIES: AAA family ATPase [Chryseobacterium]MDR6525689.1 putative ATPase [Chryseobacterium rhizosphaerae]SMC40552.1 AAA domain-containing protein, putative AbiEii toxin, Type IV TA system [Chryseobacterium sp. YR221]